MVDFGVDWVYCYCVYCYVQVMWVGLWQFQFNVDQGLGIIDWQVGLGVGNGVYGSGLVGKEVIGCVVCGFLERCRIGQYFYFGDEDDLF